MSRHGSTGSSGNERVALVFEGTEYTYAQLHALAGGLAATLADNGVKAGAGSR